MYRHENIELKLFVSSIFRLQMKKIYIINNTSKLLADNMKKINSTLGIQLLVGFAGPKMSMKNETPLIRF